QSTVPSVIAPAQAVAWNSPNVQHVYGLPNAKLNEKGSLTIDANGLKFAGKSSHVEIPLQSIKAVSAGNQRVELWGMKGRILRMGIPDGGGLVAAMLLQHKVDMLTIEFSDSNEAYHGVVFILPENEADQAIQTFAKMPVVQRDPKSSACQDGWVRPDSVLVSAPNWDQAKVPAAYRALVYEHMIDRLRHMKEIDRVYRDGETTTQQGCPQYTIGLSITGFKPGSSVQRAWTGPIGMFVGTTQMVFDATISDATGKLNLHKETKATVRGETESTNVANEIAKKLTKQFSAARKKVAGRNLAKGPEARVS
ncbi:MAG: hypothetical protein P4K80_07360, partial [Acidobacteriaceae bacterium]|nr:hypothetical protein [Acidobacteriaceae bacterium]